MEMPLMPGLDDGAAPGASTLADMLGALAPEDVAALSDAASSAMASGELDDAPADPSAPVPESDETPADEAAEIPAEQAAEDAAGTEMHTAEQYADIATAAVASIADLKSRVDELLSGAEEHAKAGLDTGPVEDAAQAVQDASDAADEAEAAAVEEAGKDEPDVGAAAQAAHDAQAACAAAQQAVAAAEAAIKAAVDDADDPDIAAMRAWSDSMHLSGGMG